MDATSKPSPVPLSDLRDAGTKRASSAPTGLDVLERGASDRFNLLSQNFYELATLTAATGRNIVIALPYMKRATSGMTHLRTKGSWICSSRLDRN
jgi:hypothetical protein